MPQKRLLIFAVASLVLAGCASQGARETAPGAEAAPPATGGVQTSPATTTRPASPSATAPSAAAPSAAAGLPGVVIYFDFDSSAIRPDVESGLEQWSRYLAANTSTTFSLQGHCDERGTREYNVGLGERRAQAVKQALMVRGVSQHQFKLESFGEERPVDTGHDETAWTKNRRVEIAPTLQ